VARSVEFWSSTEYKTFLEGLTRELTAAGWPARHHFTVPLDDYWHARSRLARWLLRFRTYAIYPAKLAARFARAKPGTIGVVCTNNFYAPRWAQIAAGGRAPIVHWVLDLYPDVLVAAGHVRAGGLLERRLRGLIRRTFDHAAANVFLGEHLLRRAERQHGPIPRAHVIPIGSDGAPFRDAEPSTRPGEAVCRLLYCGNLGRMHDVDTLQVALDMGVPRGLDLEFRGNGAGLRALEAGVRRAGNRTANVRFADNVAAAQWVAVMRAADVALVSVRRGAEGLIMPSKTYSALVAGQAVLAVCPAESDLAALVRQHDAGWVIEPGDSDGLAATLRWIASNPREVMAKRRNAWRAGHAYYDQRALVPAWTHVLEGAETFAAAAD
jgi:colanic acid biosynthesis glycosyl transferase WcaI